MSTKSIFLIVLSFLSIQRSYGQYKLKLDSLCEHYNESQDIFGSIEISIDGNRTYFNSIGYKNLHLKTEADTNTTYAIGSITKTFVATAILKLVENGHLNLSDSLSKWFPEILKSDRITILDLLNHQSGLSDENYFQWRYGKKKLKLVRKAKYANINYGLLGRILEKNQGDSLGNILDSLIFNPLKLSNTTYGLDSNRISQLATAYTTSTWYWAKTNRQSFLDAGGAGAIISNSQDINTFFHQLFSSNLLNKASIVTMTTMKDGIGLGIFPAQYRNLSGYSNSGQFGDYTSTVVYFPSKKLGVSILCNASSISLNSLLKSVMDIYYNEFY